MPTPIHFASEERSNAVRDVITQKEPIALRTFTPSQAVLSKSAGVFHWTPEGRRLYDYSSGVLVANLGHNPVRWMQKFAGYMGWKAEHLSGTPSANGAPAGFFGAVPMTAYNAISEIEAESVRRLLKNVQSFPGSSRLDTVMWAASGSEAIQKALWACLHRDESRDIILATRYGFHGKKGLAGAVTGSEKDRDRDPRVKFIAFPMDEVDDVSKYGQSVDLSKYEAELESMWKQYGKRINCLITEPYLGGGGSFHPPKEYLQLLQRFCRAHDILFILDEVQANFGRTGCMYAFEKYGLEPDFDVMGKGLGNGVPVAAVVGRGDIMGCLKYGEASDTWSANPLSCAAVLATLDEFEQHDVIGHTRKISKLYFEELAKLKETPLIAKVRGEGLVFGIECAAVGSLTPNEVANRIVEACYLGKTAKGAGGDGIHLLGALAGKVIRISPPNTITEQEARQSLELLHSIVGALAESLCGAAAK